MASCSSLKPRQRAELTGNQSIFCVRGAYVFGELFVDEALHAVVLVGVLLADVVDVLDVVEQVVLELDVAREARAVAVELVSKAYPVPLDVADKAAARQVLVLLLLVLPQLVQRVQDYRRQDVYHYQVARQERQQVVRPTVPVVEPVLVHVRLPLQEVPQAP